MVHFAYARSRSCNAGIRGPTEQVHEVLGVPQAPSCVGANIVCEQGKTQCIPQRILVFYFESLHYAKFDCALSLYELIGTLVALCLPSSLSLITLLAIVRHS
jgi:hypothetical protein